MRSRERQRSEATAKTNVAIACQGGGSHTAFTAGVLRELFQSPAWDDYELVGISGSSGGAFNALAVWYGLVTADEQRAIDLLEALWADITVSSPGEHLFNNWLVALSRIDMNGVPLPQVSPYHNPGSDWGQAQIRRILERHIDLDAISTLCERSAPLLVVGTVDVEAGTFDTFINEEVTPEAILASAAVPLVFEGVEIDGNLHWDGLFSQNPPVKDLVTADEARTPDELWVIQIDNQERPGTPTTLEEITARRSELAGNLSLNQELRFIEKVNEWIDAGYLPESEFTHTEIRRIEMQKRYHSATKMDRSQSFIDDLLELGERRAREFLADL